jgi:Transglycosylase SLT domain
VAETVSVDGYVAGIDQLLTRGHNLFPASGGGLNVDAAPGPAVPDPPPGGGSLTQGVTGAAGNYRDWLAKGAALDADTSDAASDGSEAAAQGRANTAQIRDAARAQAAAIRPVTDSPAGVRLLVSSMDGKLGQLQRELDTANAQSQLIATRLRQLAVGYRGGMGGGPAGGGGGGGMPIPGGGGLGGLGGLSGLPTLPGAVMRGGHPGGGHPGAAGNQSGPPVGAAGIAEGHIPLSAVSFEGKGLWPGGQLAIRRYLEEALDKMGITDPRARANWISGMTTIADHESSFRADAINLSDSNAHGPQQVDGGPLHATRGSWQVMPDTFAQYHQPGTSNHIWDPVANAAASMNYQMGRYGVAHDASNQRAAVGQANPGVYHAY